MGHRKLDVHDRGAAEGLDAAQRREADQPERPPSPVTWMTIV
jgi:hypothetical protein